jgi:hypothetical protein
MSRRAIVRLLVRGASLSLCVAACASGSPSTRSDARPSTATSEASAVSSVDRMGTSTTGQPNRVLEQVVAWRRDGTLVVIDPASGEVVRSLATVAVRLGVGPGSLLHKGSARSRTWSCARSSLVWNDESRCRLEQRRSPAVRDPGGARTAGRSSTGPLPWVNQPKPQ